ncbi:ligand-effect modulator 3 family [Dipodascopsis uninucleata]
MPLIHRRHSHESDNSLDDIQTAPVEKKPKSRKPPNTAFRQQRLKAWQPILTPKTVLPIFFVIGIVFAPIGGALLYASLRVQDLQIDYTHCASAATSYEDIPSEYVSSHFRNSDATINAQWMQYTNSSAPSGYQIVCKLKFKLEKELSPPVLVYYRLTNFYQNHRRYVQSFEEDQINGDAKSAESLKSSDLCKPLIVNSEGKPYYPCGLIANSYFNDTFYSAQYLGDIGINDANTENTTYVFTDKGISWSQDRKRFKKTNYKASEIVPPPNWQASFPDGYTDDNLPDISQWESLQNWMRTAALPTFSKLALRNDTTTMKAGVYEMDIGMRFPVTVYGGTKTLVISTRSAIGGHNPFIGIAYLVVGCLCILIGILFTLRHIIKPRKLGDHTYLSWNNENNANT